MDEALHKGASVKTIMTRMSGCHMAPQPNFNRSEAMPLLQMELRHSHAGKWDMLKSLGWAVRTGVDPPHAHSHFSTRVRQAGCRPGVWAKKLGTEPRGNDCAQGIHFHRCVHA